MSAVVDDLATYLINYSPTLSLTSGTNLFRFELQPAPHFQVALIPYGGMAPDGNFGKEGVRFEHARIQVVVRGVPKDRRTPHTKADLIYLAFAKIEAETVGSSFYHRAWPLQTPNHIGVDAEERPMFSFNLDIYRDFGQ